MLVSFFYMFDAIRNFVPFVQFIKRWKDSWRSLTFTLLKATLFHRCFSYFLNCTKCYQIVQSISICIAPSWLLCTLLLLLFIRELLLHFKIYLYYCFRCLLTSHLFHSNITLLNKFWCVLLIFFCLQFM